MALRAYSEERTKARIMSSIVRELLAFRPDAAHMSVAGAARGGPCPPFLVEPLAASGQVPFPKRELPGPSVGPSLGSHKRATGKVSHHENLRNSQVLQQREGLWLYRT
jgi:hypothetical protein